LDTIDARRTFSVGDRDTLPPRRYLSVKVQLRTNTETGNAAPHYSVEIPGNEIGRDQSHYNGDRDRMDVTAASATARRRRGGNAGDQSPNGCKVRPVGNSLRQTLRAIANGGIEARVDAIVASD
jgi:hypothetical protein